MCLLFLKYCRSASPNAFKLVLVSVRDEVYTRPTVSSSDWTGSGLFGPKDLQDGGTWLALSKQNGRIGVLLNLLNSKERRKDIDVVSRGRMVVDYLTAEQETEEFLESKFKDLSLYKAFTLVSLEPNSSNGYEAFVLSNTLSTPRVDKLLPGISVIGNNKDLDKPWNKVSYGAKKFEEVLLQHETSQTRDKLVDDIFDMLSDKTRLDVDSHLMEQGEGLPTETIQKLSTLYVEIPEMKYGTRTQTIVLIDGDDNVNWVEKTMTNPIIGEKDSINTNWTISRHTFKIGHSAGTNSLQHKL